jgi:hypothetical protein
VTVEDIQAAIQRLREPDRRKLADWLFSLEEAEWDGEIERDFAPGGRGAPLLDAINREIRDGKAQALDDGLARRRKRRV